MTSTVRLPQTHTHAHAHTHEELATHGIVSSQSSTCWSLSPANSSQCSDIRCSRMDLPLLRKLELVTATKLSKPTHKMCNPLCTINHSVNKCIQLTVLNSKWWCGHFWWNHTFNVQMAIHLPKKWKGHSQSKKRDDLQMHTNKTVKRFLPALITCLACSFFFASSGLSCLERLVAALRIFSFSLSCRLLSMILSMLSRTFNWPLTSVVASYWELSCHKDTFR